MVLHCTVQKIWHYSVQCKSCQDGALNSKFESLRAEFKWHNWGTVAPKFKLKALRSTNGTILFISFWLCSSCSVLLSLFLLSSLTPLSSFSSSNHNHNHHVYPLLHLLLLNALTSDFSEVSAVCQMSHIFSAIIPELHINIIYYEWLLCDIKRTINNMAGVFASM